jgi:hypothetical protein
MVARATVRGPKARNEAPSPCHRRTSPRVGQLPSPVNHDPQDQPPAGIELAVGPDASAGLGHIGMTPHRKGNPCLSSFPTVIGLGEAMRVHCLGSVRMCAPPWIRSRGAATPGEGGGCDPSGDREPAVWMTPSPVIVIWRTLVSQERPLRLAAGLTYRTCSPPVTRPVSRMSELRPSKPPATSARWSHRSRAANDPSQQPLARTSSVTDWTSAPGRCDGDASTRNSSNWVKRPPR